MEDIITERIVVDENCERLIRQNVIQYNYLAILFFLYSLINFILVIARLIKNNALHNNTSVNHFYYLIYPLATLLNISLAVTSAVLHFKALRLQQSSIDQQQQYFFSKSFEYYRRGNGISIVNISLSIVMITYSLFKENLN